MLFDFGHTLFDTGSSVDFLVERSARLGRPLGHAQAHDLWEDARLRSRTPVEITKGRDRTPTLHRQCWIDLWAPIEALCPGLTGELYELETTYRGWQPYTDTRDVVDRLRRRHIVVVVVSDVAFDLRPILAHYGIEVDDVVLSYEHGALKADGPHLFRVALERNDLVAADSIFVGDNPANDGQSITAGVASLLLPPAATGHARGLSLVESLLK